MAVTKRWHVSITSTESPKAKHLSVSKFIGSMIIGSLVLMLLCIAASLTYIAVNQSRLNTIHTLEQENTLLKDRLALLSSEVDSILAKLQVMEDWEDTVRSKENLKEINKEIREMGMGGMPQVDSTFIFLGDAFHNSYNSLLKKLSLAKSKTEFDVQTHDELVRKLNLKTLLYQNTPSIYPTYGRISDKYGWRRHPITKRRSYHQGLDFANKVGTPIYATANGVVKKTGRKKLFGNYITLNHKFGYQTKYAHLDKVLVKSGDTVTRGQIIGLMGNTGRSTGAHLHYEVLRYNKHRNPTAYLNKLESDIVLAK